jgi:hypothetical protein
MDSAADARGPQPYPVPLHRDVGARLRRRTETWVARERARRRPVLDVGFAVVLPPVLFVLDRTLDALQRIEPGGLVPRRPYTPLLALASVTVYAAWMATRRRPGWAHAVLAGPLVLGAAFAAGVGLLLLPYSLIGILAAGLGLLGFVPFVTAFAFGRAALIAYDAARPTLAVGPRRALAVLAATCVAMGVVGAGRVAVLVERRATEVLAGERSGDAGRAETALRLLWIVPQVRLEFLRDTAREETRAGGWGPAAIAYERITGLSHLDASD